MEERGYNTNFWPSFIDVQPPLDEQATMRSDQDAYSKGSISPMPHAMQGGNEYLNPSVLTQVSNEDSAYGTQPSGHHTNSHDILGVSRNSGCDYSPATMFPHFGAPSTSGFPQTAQNLNYTDQALAPSQPAHDCNLPPKVSGRLSKQDTGSIPLIPKKNKMQRTKRSRKAEDLGGASKVYSRQTKRQRPPCRGDLNSEDHGFVRDWLKYRRLTRARDVDLQTMDALAVVMNKDISHIVALLQQDLDFDDVIHGHIPEMGSQGQESRTALAQRYADNAGARECKKSKKSNSCEGRYQCIFKGCDYQTDTVDALKRHLDVRRPSKVYVCVMCQSSFSGNVFIHQRTDKFRDHMSAAHDLREPDTKEMERKSLFHPNAKGKLRCGFCRDKFLVLLDFRDHIIDHFKYGDLDNSGRPWDVRRDWKDESQPEKDDAEDVQSTDNDDDEKDRSDTEYSSTDDDDDDDDAHNPNAGSFGKFQGSGGSSSRGGPSSKSQSDNGGTRQNPSISGFSYLHFQHGVALTHSEKAPYPTVPRASFPTQHRVQSPNLRPSGNEKNQKEWFANAYVAMDTISEAMSGVEPQEVAARANTVADALQSSIGTKESSVTAYHARETCVQSPNALQYQPDVESCPLGSFLRHSSSLTRNHLTFLKTLGCGASGSVDKVQVTSTGSVYARKAVMISRDGPAVRASLEREVAILRSISHPNLPTLMGTYVYGSTLNLLMRPVAKMNLKECLDKPCSKKIDETNLFTWCGNLASALNALHTANVRHGDIKPSNVLVIRTLTEATVSEKLMLTDFGASRFVSATDSESSSNCAMTPMYAAPEIVKREKHGRRADVFSLACVFLELITSHLTGSLDELMFHLQLLPGLSENSPRSTSYSEKIQGITDWLDQLGQQATPSVSRLLDLCQSMFARRAGQRPTARYLDKNGPWGNLCESHLEPDSYSWLGDDLGSMEQEDGKDICQLVAAAQNPGGRTSQVLENEFEVSTGSSDDEVVLPERPANTSESDDAVRRKVVEQNSHFGQSPVHRALTGPISNLESMQLPGANNLPSPEAVMEVLTQPLPRDSAFAYAATSRPGSSDGSRPKSSRYQSRAREIRNTPTTCTNCYTQTTPLWRQSSEGYPLCNVCGPRFLKLRGIVPSPSLKTDVIKKRNRGARNTVAQGRVGISTRPAGKKGRKKAPA